jgi:Rad3-related DNA helicase
MSSTADVLLAPTASLFAGGIGESDRPKILVVDECHRLDSAARNSYSFDCELEDIMPQVYTLFGDLNKNSYYNQDHVVHARKRVHFIWNLLYIFLKIKWSARQEDLSDKSDVLYTEVSPLEFCTFLREKYVRGSLEIMKYLHQVRVDDRNHFSFATRWIKFWDIVHRILGSIREGIADYLQNDFCFALTKKGAGPVVFHSICLRGKIPLEDVFERENIHRILFVSGTYDKSSVDEEFGLGNLVVCTDSVAAASQYPVKSFCVTHFLNSSPILCTEASFDATEIARLITGIAKATIGNTVVFAPSYKVCQLLQTSLQNRGSLPFSLSIESNSRTSFDNSEESSDLKTLTLAVMRGKLAEGVNLPEGSVRCIIIVGVPIPKLDDPYIRKKSSIDSSFPYKDAMVAVNQAIGRLYRGRKGDGGMIIFLDKRFENPPLRSRLPFWVNLVSVDEQGVLEQIPKSNYGYLS